MSDEAEDLASLMSGGDDSPPLMQYVPDPPPSHWGVVTSKRSTEYDEFLARHRKDASREDRSERRG